MSNTLAQIKTWPHKTAVPFFTAKITKVRKRFSGQGDHGEWSFQDIEVQDSSGTIIVCLDKREEVPQSWQGMLCDFVASEHQGKACGVYSEDHTPKATERNPRPETFRRIRVTPSAQIYESQDGQQGGQQQPPPQRQQGQQSGLRSERYGSPSEAYQGNNNAGGGQRQQPAQNGNQRTEAAPQNNQRQQSAPNQQGNQRQPRKGDPNEAILTAKKLAARIGVCKQIAFNAAAANAWAAWETHGIKTAQEGVGAEASGIFIEMMRKMDLLTFESLPFVAPHSDKNPRPLSELYDLVRAETVARNQVSNATPAQQRDDVPAGATPEQVEQYDQRRQPPENGGGGQRTARPQSMPRSQPLPRQQPTQQVNDDMPEDWRDGMEDDDIPF